MGQMGVVGGSDEGTNDLCPVRCSSVLIPTPLLLAYLSMGRSARRRDNNHRHIVCNTMGSAHLITRARGGHWQMTMRNRLRSSTNRNVVCAAVNTEIVNLDATYCCKAAASPPFSAANVKALALVLYPVFNLASSGEYPMRNAMRAAHIRNGSLPIGLLLDGLPGGDRCWKNRPTLSFTGKMLHHSEMITLAKLRYESSPSGVASF